VKGLRLRARFLGPFFGLLLLGLVAAGSLPASVALHAQTPAQAATSDSRSGSNASAQPGPQESTAKQERQDMDVFRHAPIVQSLARLFHLDVETTARLFEILNFGIILLAILIPLFKVFPKLLRGRAQALKHDIESARKMTEEAKARISAVEEKLSRLNEEIAAIRAQVEEEGKHDEQRIKASIEEETSRIVAAAEQEISAAAAHAQRGLRSFAADLAIEQASRQLVLTPDTDRALISEFMKETANGGKN